MAALTQMKGFPMAAIAATGTGGSSGLVTTWAFLSVQIHWSIMGSGFLFLTFILLRDTALIPLILILKDFFFVVSLFTHV